MIEGLKPYAEYKESEVPWIGKIPQHWRILPNRALLKLKKKSVGMTSGEYTLLSLTKQGVIPRDLENPSGKFPANFETYQMVEPGDLIFCLFDIDETPRAVGLSNLQGMITGAYTRFTCTDPSSTRFVYLFYLAMDNGKLLKPLYSGLRKVITKSTFLSAKTLLPPPDEQAVIVRFLDHANGKIDRFIRTKRRLIELLNEEKQFIIHRAVTRGIDPNVKLKPSGINWLGDVPEHWGIQKLKRLTTQIVDGTHFTPKYTDQGVPFLRVKDIHSNTLKMETLMYTSFDEHLQLNRRCNPEKGDVLLSKNGTIGITKVVDWDFQFSIFVSLCLIKLRKNLIDPYFLSYIFKGKILDEQIRDTTKTTSVTNLHLDKINNFVVIVPSIEEQRMIIEHLRVVLLSSEQAIERTRREIDLLREYRTRLISDVVTGKLDVRGIELPAMDEAEVLEDVKIDDEIEAEDMIESEEVTDADE